LISIPIFHLRLFAISNIALLLSTILTEYIKLAVKDVLFIEWGECVPAVSWAGIMTFVKAIAKAIVSAMCHTICSLPFNRLHNIASNITYMCIFENSDAFTGSRATLHSIKYRGKRQLPAQMYQISMLHIPFQRNDSELSLLNDFQFQFQWPMPMPGADKLTRNLAGFNCKRTSLKRRSAAVKGCTRANTAFDTRSTPIKRLKVCVCVFMCVRAKNFWKIVIQVDARALLFLFGFR